MTNRCRDCGTSTQRVTEQVRFFDPEKPDQPTDVVSQRLAGHGSDDIAGVSMGLQVCENDLPRLCELGDVRTEGLVGDDAAMQHHERIALAIGTQLDFGRPDEFADEEAFVAPGIIYARTPRDPD